MQKESRKSKILAIDDLYRQQVPTTDNKPWQRLIMAFQQVPTTGINQQILTTGARKQ